MQIKSFENETKNNTSVVVHNLKCVASPSVLEIVSLCRRAFLSAHPPLLWCPWQMSLTSC